MLAVVGTASACKADKKKCEAACRNHFTLVYQAELDAELAKAPEVCPPAPVVPVPGELERAQAPAAVLGTAAVPLRFAARWMNGLHVILPFYVILF